MKAWLVRRKGEFEATVVFAETRGKARELAMAKEACEDTDFCDIEAHRKPQMDKYYEEGKKEMNWFNPKDRIALVKDCGFICNVDYFEEDDCIRCPAKEYCEKYQDYLESEVQEDGH